MSVTLTAADPVRIRPLVFAAGVSALLFFAPVVTQGEEPTQLIIGNFSGGELASWEEKKFSGQTIYQITELDGQRVLSAQAQNSASGLFKKTQIDLLDTPYLNWSWRIDNHLAPLDEKSKAGDDYSVRLYVVIDGGLYFWRTRSLTYVWSSQPEQDKIWVNAYAGRNAMMLAVRAQGDNTKTWYWEKRDVFKDLKTIFGEEIRYIDAVALMTDTDDSNGQASSYYGDIYFTA